MARIAGVDVPNNKKVEGGLTHIYGVGRKVALKILNETSIDTNKRVGDLSEQEISLIRKFIDSNIKVEGDLRKDISMSIKRLIEIGCYRAYRHKNNLSCRGQKTRSNARTIRGLAGKRGIKKK